MAASSKSITRTDVRNALGKSAAECSRLLGVNGKSALRPFLRGTLGVYVGGKHGAVDDTTLAAVADAVHARYVDGKSAKDARAIMHDALGKSKSK